jgi:hypothetical protein
MDPIHPIRPTTEQPAAVDAARPVARAGKQRADESRRERRERRERQERRQPAEPAPYGEHVDVRV